MPFFYFFEQDQSEWYKEIGIEIYDFKVGG